MRILVQNRQRRYKVNLVKIEKMANKLSFAVIENLKKNKPKMRWTPHLSKIDELANLSLIIVSPRTIKKLNKEWRSKDKETDVLSFPLLDLSSAHIENELSFLDLEPLEFGELFISYEQAITQAQEYNHSLDRELAFLFVHGLLHIFGFDHENKVDEKEMFGRQRKILNETSFYR